jgi:DNA-binding transcriptional LysR family regulator
LTVDTDLLATFLAVARHESYARAGTDLHLSQSAVWRQVQKLEARLGVKLFETLGRSVHLTDAGRTFRSEAELILGNLRRAEELVRVHAEEVLGRIKVGASTTPGYYLLPPALGEFHRKYPDVDIHFEVDNSAVIEEKVLRNDLDLAFVGVPLRDPALVGRCCLRDEIGCFTHAHHPLASLRRVPLRRLCSELCVTREEGSATRRMFEEWVRKKGVTLGKRMVVRCPEALKALVAAGIGFSFLSVHGIAREVERGELVRLPVIGMSLRRPITIAWHVGKHLSPVLRAFLEIANRVCRGH